MTDWVKHCGFNEHEAADIVMACGEAVENAIEHGQDELCVVEGTCDDKLMTIQVRDKGPGFDVAGHGLPADPELQRVRGLGVYLMRALMDEARFERLNGAGTVVTLIKKRRSS